MRVAKTGSDFKTGSAPDIASLIRATADPGYLLLIALSRLSNADTPKLMKPCVEDGIKLAGGRD